MCDRILVLSLGRVTAELSRGEATQERIMEAATSPAGGGGVTELVDTTSVSADRRRSVTAPRHGSIPAALPECLRARRHPHRLGDRRPGTQWRERLPHVAQPAQHRPLRAENGIIAVGMTPRHPHRRIDLSVGAVMALCAVASADLMMNQGSTFLTIFGPRSRRPRRLDQRADHHSPADPVVHHHPGDARRRPWRGVAVADGYAIPLAFGDGEGMAPPLYKSLFAGELSILGLEVPAPVFYFLGVGLIAASRCGAPASAATSTPSAATPRRHGCPASTSTGSG